MEGIRWSIILIRINCLVEEFYGKFGFFFFFFFFCLPDRWSHCELFVVLELPGVEESNVET